MRERAEALGGTCTAGTDAEGGWTVAAELPGGVAGRPVVIRVLLVDDQPLIHAGLNRILAPEADLEIVGECADGDEVPAAVAAHRPDVVLMDVRMKRLGGPEATRRLREHARRPRSSCSPRSTTTRWSAPPSGPGPPASS